MQEQQVMVKGILTINSIYKDQDPYEFQNKQKQYFDQHQQNYLQFYSFKFEKQKEVIDLDASLIANRIMQKVRSKISPTHSMSPKSNYVTSAKANLSQKYLWTPKNQGTLDSKSTQSRNVTPLTHIMSIPNLFQSVKRTDDNIRSSALLKSFQKDQISFQKEQSVQNSRVIQSVNERIMRGLSVNKGHNQTSAAALYLGKSQHYSNVMTQLSNNKITSKNSQKNTLKKANSQNANSRIGNPQKPSLQKLNSQQPNQQKSDSQEANLQKANSQKNNSDKVNPIVKSLNTVQSTRIKNFEQKKKDKDEILELVSFEQPSLKASLRDDKIINLLEKMNSYMRSSITKQEQKEYQWDSGYLKEKRVNAQEFTKKLLSQLRETKVIKDQYEQQFYKII